MSYTIGRVRRWDAGGVTTTSSAVNDRRAVAEHARLVLSDGREALDAGWDGTAADAVLAAAEGENDHVTRLGDGLADLVDTLARAAAALGPAVQSVRDRVAAAEAAGLAVGEDSVGPAPGRDDIGQGTVDGHVEALSMALDTVRSLDEHYGREIDVVATLLYEAIPPEVNRRPIPGSDNAPLGTVATVLTGAARTGAPNWADELDPETRGRHTLNPVPDDLGHRDARLLRGIGRFAGPLGAGFTVYDGLQRYASGETSAGEAIFETTGALGGGMAGGAATGALAGSFLGPVGALVGGGIGAGLGAWAGHEVGGAAHDAWADGSGAEEDRDGA